MSNLPTTFAQSAPSGNLRLSEAMAALVPEIEAPIAHLDAFAVHKMGETAGNTDAGFTMYIRRRLLTVDQVRAMLADLRSRFGDNPTLAALLDREVKIRDAAASLHEAFFRGDVVVFGIKKGSADANHLRIPPAYFSATRVLDWHRNAVQPSDSAVVQARRARAWFRTAQDDEFDNVLVDANSFRRWLKKSEGAARAKNSPAQNAVSLAIVALGADGLPNTLTWQQRDEAIQQWCVQHGHRRPSASSISRAFRARGSAAAVA